MKVLSILMDCGESNGHRSFHRKRNSEVRSVCCAVHLQGCHVERHLEAMDPGYIMWLNLAGKSEEETLQLTHRQAIIGLFILEPFKN